MGKPNTITSPGFREVMQALYGCHTLKSCPREEGKPVDYPVMPLEACGGGGWAFDIASPGNWHYT